MRLTVEQVEKISGLILEGLKEKGLVTFKADEAKVLERVREIILGDLRAEDDLDREVERIIEAHSGEIDSGGLDYRKMFQMIKHKLARERGMVL